MSTQKKQLALTGSMLAALGAMSMLGPFGTDTYLPALPVISEDFDSTMSRAQLTIAMFTIGHAIGQFVLGALSDRFGRKIIIVGGGTLMTVASAASIFVSSMELLIVLCLTMGLTAAGGIAGGRAVVADLTHGEESARPFAILSMLLSVGPIIGPIGGTILLSVGGWRSIFVGLTIFAAVSTVAAALLVPETLPTAKRHKGGLVQAFRASGKVLTNKQFFFHGAILWCGFGLMFGYISSSSFIIQNVLELSPAVNAASFAVNGAVLIVASLFTAKFNTGRNPRRFITVGVSVQVVAIALLAVSVIGHIYNPVFVLFILLLIGAAMGFVFGPATAFAMLEVRASAGTASALIGSFQFVAAGIVTISMGFVSPDPLTGLLVSGGIATVGAVIFAILGARLGAPAETRATP